MAAKAAMIEVGMASAAMIVERKFHRKRKTTDRGEKSAEDQVLFDRMQAKFR